MSREKRTPSRFPLLTYQHPSRQQLNQATWLLVLSAVLWFISNYAPQPAIYAGIGISGILLGLLSGIIALLKRGAYIRCKEQAFTLRGPWMYTVNFSYSRIASVRPVQFNTLFPPEEQKNRYRRDFAKLWTKTAIVIDLKSSPVALKWLRFWYGPYLLLPKEKSLVLVTNEWMALSRQLENGRLAWIERRKARAR